MANHQKSKDGNVERMEEEIPDMSKHRARELVTDLLTNAVEEENGDCSSDLASLHHKRQKLDPESGSLDWALWQLLDSLFPTGGFAHSYGLEAAFQARSVHDSTTLERFICNSLRNNAALLLPFVFAGHRFSNIDWWLELNNILNATLTNHVARKASLSQGSALLRAGATVFTEFPELKKMRVCAHKPIATTPHHTPIFGVVCGLLGVDEMKAQQSYLFLSLRDILSAGTRLNIIGPMEAATIQHRLAPVCEALVKRYSNQSIRDAHQTGPLLEVFQAGHNQLFSRMFCS